MEEIKWELQNLIITMETLSDNIYHIETTVRHSIAYKKYLGYVYASKEFMGSPDYSDVNLKDKQLTSEFHHLITLWDLCMMVGTKMLLEDTDRVVLIEDVASEVIRLHLKDYIPGVILTKNYHEAVTACIRKVDSNCSGLHLGNYKVFIKKYNDCLTVNDYKMYLSLGADVEFINKYYKEDSNEEV